MKPNTYERRTTGSFRTIFMYASTEGQTSRGPPRWVNTMPTQSTSPRKIASRDRRIIAAARDSVTRRAPRASSNAIGTEIPNAAALKTYPVQIPIAAQIPAPKSVPTSPKPIPFAYAGRWPSARARAPSPRTRIPSKSVAQSCAGSPVTRMTSVVGFVRHFSHSLPSGGPPAAARSARPLRSCFTSSAFARIIGAWTYTSSLTDISRRKAPGLSPSDWRRSLSPIAAATRRAASGVKATWNSIRYFSERTPSITATGNPRYRPKSHEPRAFSPREDATSARTFDVRRAAFAKEGACSASNKWEVSWRSRSGTGACTSARFRRLVNRIAHFTGRNPRLPVKEVVPAEAELETRDATTTAMATTAPPAASPTGETARPCGVTGVSRTVTLKVEVATFPDVSVTRTRIVFNPSRRVRATDHDVVPEAWTHVVPEADTGMRVASFHVVPPSRLTSTFATATSSDAVPVRVTLVESSTLLFVSETSGIVGLIESGGAVGVAEISVDFGLSPIEFTAVIQ